MRTILIMAVTLVALGAGLAAAADQPAPARHPFVGSYQGSFAGDMSGGWQVEVAADGTATATATSGGESGKLTGKAAETGEIWMTGSQGSEMLLAAGLLQRVNGQVRGSGAWITTTKVKGTWRLGTPAAATAATYQGKYDGDDAGGFTLQVSEKGAATAIFDSLLVGKVTTTGELAADGKLTLAGSVQGTKLTTSGTLKNGAGSGTWQYGSDASGTWEITSPAAAAAPAEAAPAVAANPFVGPYTGSFTGPASGSVSLQVAADGTTQGTFTTGSNKVELTGTVGADGKVALTGTLQAQTVTVTGTLTGSGDSAAAKGTWEVASFQGEWTAKPGEAAK